MQEQNDGLKQPSHGAARANAEIFVANPNVRWHEPFSVIEPDFIEAEQNQFWIVSFVEDKVISPVEGTFSKGTDL